VENSAEHVYSVTQVTSYIRDRLQQDYALSGIRIRGEVSNCKYHPSGHIYFTLKDAGAQMSCVLFASARGGLKYHMADGDSVVCYGSVGVYEAAGRYQLYVREIVPAGSGLLALEFERLKKKLAAEGIFAEEHKIPIPAMPAKIGIVTAESGAALQDILQIARRRDPYVQMILCPAQVQGEGAAASIAAAVRTLDRAGVDVIIVGRGGGSIEDLWTFNEEETAYAIYACRTPIISAVGHETDTTIADLAADLRAPTPSAAAELAVPDIAAVLAKIDHYAKRLQHAGPAARLQEKKNRLQEQERLLNLYMQQNLMRQKHRMELLAGRLAAVSPAARLSGGYAFVTDREGRALRSVRQAAVGDSLTITASDGQITACVTKTEEEKNAQEDSRS